jgi:hypothetical protein
MKTTLAALFVCIGLALVQPGVSYYWLIDPQVHAQIDEELYGQAPDGHPLPDRPRHPPHTHPTNDGDQTSVMRPSTDFHMVFQSAVLAAAQCPALNGKCLELLDQAQSVVCDLPDPPPRA